MPDTTIDINLNDLSLYSVIKCPYCDVNGIYSYEKTGKFSSKCPRCNRIVLWDVDNNVGYKVKARKYEK